MSSGGTVTPPQTSTTQIPAFGMNVSSSIQQQQQQQQQQQLQSTLNHLFPNGTPFNFPCFNAIATVAAANSAAAVAASSTTAADGFSPALRHPNYEGFTGQSNSRIKIKRCRQRVDAGEPRNSYQSQLKNNGGSRKEPISLRDLSQFSLNFDSQNNSSYNNNKNIFQRLFNENTPSENDYAEEMDGVEGGENGALNCSLSTAKSTGSSASSVASSSARRKSCRPKRQHADNYSSDPFDENIICNNNNNEDNECDDDFNKSVEYIEAEHTSDDDDQKTDYSANGRSGLKIVINRRYNTVNNIEDLTEADGVTDDEDHLPGGEGLAASEHGSEKDEEGHRSLSQSSSIHGADADETGDVNKEEPELDSAINDFADDATFSARFDESPTALSLSKEEEDVKNASARFSSASSTSATNLLSSLFLTNNNNNDNAEKTENNDADLNRFQNMLEAQRKLYSIIFMEQQRKSLASLTSEEPAAAKEFSHRPGSSSLMFQQQQNLPQKSETKTASPFNALFSQMKPNGHEQLAHLLRFIEVMTLAQRQQQQMAEMFQQKQRCQPLQSQNLLNGSSPNLLALNPALAAIATAAAAAANNNRNAAQAPTSMARHPAYSFGANENGGGSISSGIFPPASAIPTSFHSFIGSSLFQPSTSFRDDSGPRRKRAKVTDSVRGPRSSVRADCTSSSSQPVSERSSPQAGVGVYFPPTMVTHPSLYGRASGSRNDSPINASDEFVSADYFSTGGNVGSISAPLTAIDGIHQQMYTLTHVHLRKAKLMFFYTRYPSSAVLKTYFPDIHFNKNNTAQLVKWFSNFREFYYMQMEKYAKQAIAEGIRHRDDITVTSDSEIYKQLNQHYNRNNLIQPPVRLLYVIQETLKEFFVALQAGKDSEPSWKKVIYKIIQQLDDPIPEYFKDPNFIETLEQS